MHRGVAAPVSLAGPARCVIVGAGAVGLSFACALTRAGVRVTLCGRAGALSDPASALSRIAREGAVERDARVSVAAQPETALAGEAAVPARTRFAEVIDAPRAVQPGEVLVLCVKAPALAAVAQAWRVAQPGDPAALDVLCTQNGLDADEVVRPHLPSVRRALVVWNAVLHADGAGVTHPTPPHERPVWAQRGPTASAAFDAALGAATRCEWREQLRGEVVTKWVQNLGNVVTALIGLGARWPQRAQEIDALRVLLASTWLEGHAVAVAAGWPRARLRGVPSPLALRLLRAAPAAVVRPLFARRMRALGTSSMAQDVARGRGAVELTDLNGALVAAAAAHAVDVPFNAALMQVAAERWGGADASPSAPPMTADELLERARAVAPA